MWNVRGVNSQQKHKDIRHLIALKKVGMASLVETKIRNKDMGKFYLSLFSGWCFTTNNFLLDKGRIILEWNPHEFQVDTTSCSSQHIHSKVHKRQGECFYITFVYGFNDERGRMALWKELVVL